MNKTRIVLIILLIIAVVLLGVFWYLSRENEQESNNNLINNNLEQIENINQEAETTETIQNQTSQQEIEEYVSKISETDKLKAQLQKIAVAFVERYGSYSNQSDYENLEDLLSFMTRNLKSTTQNFINTKRSEQQDNSMYYGMTTKVLNAEIEIFSPQTNFIKFNLATQRQEMVGSSANTNVFYQNANLELKEQGGVWKVDKITWL